MKNAERWRTAAGRGNVYAQFCLAECYETGRGAEQDLRLAAYWYRRAAEGLLEKMGMSVSSAEIGEG